MRAGTPRNRLALGGLIDRGRPLTFFFDGREYQGCAGDTLASALVANEVRLVGRSFKYHRPRGILTAGSEEPNALVELRTGARREPNSKATTIELFDGLVARSQNRWPSLNVDLMAINALFAPVFVAGFYYKTFMWPAAFWEKLYEPAIRRAAGLGRAAGEPDPDHYEKAHAFCDVLVIGSGPAGLMAALTAGGSGASVILCEEDFALGGRLLSERLEIDEQAGNAWAAAVEAKLSGMPEVRIMRRTTVFGTYDSGTFGAIERVSDHLPVPPPHQPRQRLWKIVARQAVLASGAIERPIIFGGNDRPGVMMASAVRSYLNRFAATPGRRVAIFTATDDGWKTVRDLSSAGIAVEAVIDSRSDIHHDDVSLAERIGARLLTNARVVATHGGRAIQSIDVATAEGRTVSLSADCLAVSGGWNPTVGLTCHHGSKPRWSNEIHAFVPGELPRGMMAAGAVTGKFSLADILADGAKAGAAAATAVGFEAKAWTVPRTSDELARVSPFWRAADSRGKIFVDFQHDVTLADIALAHREGFRSVEHLKRYTTLGMATDQGKMSSVGGHAVMAELTARSIAETGTTVFRPPQVPVAIGAFAGHHRGKNFRPTRVPPSHGWAQEQGAVFVEAGMWLRAQWYPRKGETDWLTTVNREVRTTRSAVGVCDVSTLGKIDIQGEDAGVFLDGIYINTLSTLPVGKARYGVMLREDGFVMDDGTTSRLAPDHYLMTTTTANAAAVMQHLEFCRQVLWPELDVQLASVSEQWAQFSIAGPKSRAVVAKLVDPGFDVSNEGFPHLAVGAPIVLGDVPARLFRLSFSGELAYELAVPACYGDAAIRAIVEAGAEFGIAPYGTEALGVMRIEKGHPAGNEINGQTTARDLGFGRMMSTKKDYIGRKLAERPALLDPDRPALIGFRPLDRSARVWPGMHLLPSGAPIAPKNDQGFITSAAFSPLLDHWIGLGLLKRGPERIGERIRGYDAMHDNEVELEVCSPIFVDPEGGRLRA